MKLEEDLNNRIVSGLCCRLETRTGVPRLAWRLGFIVLHLFYVGTWVYMGGAWIMNAGDRAGQTNDGIS